MSVLRHGLVPPTATGYNIERSLRFNSADSAYLNRTPGSAGNRKTWTWSGWVKRSALGASTHFFGAYSGSGSDTTLFTVSFNSSDQLDISAFTQNWRVTSQVFRDVGAWYHIVIAFDTTQATAGDRIKLYVNGTQVTAFGTSNNPTQNTDYVVNNTVAHYVGVNSFTGNSAYFNGYLADVHLIDGSALTPSSFGENDTDTGVWKPKAYTGSYGTNGFKLTFSDNSGTTSTTLGKDTSGNGNNWTPNNFSVTAGAGNDSLVDTPTPYGTDTGAGGEVRGNYATLNPLSATNSSTSANGNLDGVISSGDTSWILGSIAVSSGKWYWEWTPTNNLIYNMVGIANADATNKSWQSATTFAYWYNGNKYTNGGGTSYGATFALNDIIGIALDMDAGTVAFYKNGVSQGTAFSGLTGTYVPYFGNAGAGATAEFTANFGQRPFAYTAPSGFKALCTTNLPTPTIGATSSTRANKYFSALPYTATGNDPLVVTGVGFQPDLVWIKVRNQARDNTLFDAVRGATKYLLSNTTGAEGTSSGSLKSFDADGFTLGNSLPSVNWVSGDSQMSWNWKANGAGSSNTAGTITSTVSANTTAGFSIVTFTTQSSGTGTVGHGLGVAPSMIITKSRAVSGSWTTYHASLGNTKLIYLDSTSAAATDTSVWNSTSPTSSVFTLGTAFAGSISIVAYCFAPVAGYSAFGSYTGNGSADGPFIYTGFRPRYVMIKRTDSTGSWYVYDSVRNTYNLTNLGLLPNTSDAELTLVNAVIDMTSNGFKIRGTDTGINASAGTYIYSAFAEVPTKFSLAR